MYLKNKKILIVDDEQGLTLFLANYMVSKGGIPFTSKNISESKKILENENIDLVLLDLNLPDGNGVDLIPYINSKYYFVPIIIISGDITQKIIAELFSKGVFSFFVKPFDIEELEYDMIKAIKLKETKTINNELIDNTQINLTTEFNTDEKFVVSLSNLIVDIFNKVRPDKKNIVNNIILSLNEILINAISHGNKNDKSKKVFVNVILNKQMFKTIITDEGEGFDYKNLSDPTLDCNLDKTTGRGIFMVKLYMDEINFYKNGNRIEVIKYL